MPAEKPAFGKKGTPLIYAGTKLTDVLTTEKSLVSTTRVSIWLDPNAPPTGRARLDAPKMTPKFPETKHTVKRVVHNIGQFPVADRVGKESYDPVLGNGNSVVDHYPYAACTDKEGLMNPNTYAASLGIKK
ncbi:hypothetical protein Ctob_009801 [Chrysochromulina tobinii]|uniref:Uncharacterized protein n=1 Tax=Chrysochromulina tobinii TaxID=1460289 RepID=A0A0M0JSX2_9EUKA|nr:hypothetical protein Ctob_009801 [Chrysochromulina tobinii]|eukprot:KOO29397.1 hypothetical protein Ctob_009801 [Chrysochromulina sp. CCMP291]